MLSNDRFPFVPLSLARRGDRGEVKKTMRCAMLRPLKMVLGLVLLLLFVVPVFAESVDTAWVRRYNGPGNDWDYGCDIVVDDSGNVYVTGLSVVDTIPWTSDYTTIKYLPNGDTAWLKRYNGPGNNYDQPYAMTIDNSGNIYVTGSSKGIGSDYDIATIKYLPNGDTVWVRRYNGPGNSTDYPASIFVDDSGNVYVGGTSQGNGTDCDYATIKYYSNGDTAWVRRYNGPPGNKEDRIHALTVDEDGNVYVTGRSEQNSSFPYNLDYTTIKYYSNGDTAWLRKYDGPSQSSDLSNGVAVDGSGNVYVTGISYDTVTSNDWVTIKYSPDGDSIWVRRFDGTENTYDQAFVITIDDSGYVYVSGSSSQNTTYPRNDDFATIKYNPDGDTIWVRRYNGPGDSDDEVRDIVIDSSGNICITGRSEGSGTGKDYATIKYYPNGDTAWVMRYDGPGHAGDFVYAIAVDGSDNVYVTGESESGGVTQEDYATIKYFPKSTDVKDETENKEKPSRFALSQNYPNPFNPTTVIHYTVRGSQFVVRSPIHTTLKIYNVLGEGVRTLVDEKKLPGDYTVQWDGKNDKGEQLASGVYFYELKVGDYTSAKKMVLLK
jgi:uncharacterized delta-60 repeat protein